MPPDTLWKCGLSIQSVTLLKSAGYLKPLEAQNMDIMAALQTLLTEVRLCLQPRLDQGWQENKKEKKDNTGITASEVVSQPVKLHYG